VNRRFQAKRSKYSNFYIFKKTNCNQILKSDKDHQILVMGLPKIWSINPKWRTAAILKKMDKLLYFSNSSADFYEILYADTYWPSEHWEMFKKPILKYPRWRTAAILKNVKCNISVAVRQDLIKFGMMMHPSSPNAMGTHKFQNFKIQNGRRLPSWK